MKKHRISNIEYRTAESRSQTLLRHFSGGACKHAPYIIVLAALLGGCGGGGDRAGYLAKSRELLPQMLKSNDPSVRGFGLEVYRDLRLAAPADALAALVRDPEVPVRFNALVLMAARAKAADQRVFEKVLAEDEDRSVRLAAAYGLAKQGDTSRLGLLAEALADKDDVAGRRNAAMLLGLLRNGSAAGMLKEHLKDPDTMVRLNVGEAMARLGDSSGLAPLRLTAWDSSSPSQVYAILALGRVGFPPEDIQNLREVQARRPSVGALLASFGARAMLGDYTQINFLIEVVTGTNRDARLTDQERALALQLLARAAYGPAWPEVGKCLGDRNLLVVYSAAWAELAFDTPRGQKLKTMIHDSEKSQMLTQEEVLRRPSPAKTPARTGPAMPGVAPLAPGVGR